MKYGLETEKLILKVTLLKQKGISDYYVKQVVLSVLATVGILKTLTQSDLMNPERLIQI